MLRLAAALIAGPAGLAYAAPTDGPTLTVVAGLQPGLWSLHSRDPDGPATRTLCLQDLRVLLQIRHEGQSCSRFIVTNSPAQAVVTYSCPGHGNGRTTLRSETPRLAQIESQGIVDNAPFYWSLEARRVGECPANQKPVPLSFR